MTPIAMDPDAERHRLAAVTTSYGDRIAPFDAAMRRYMMRSFEPFFREGACLQVGCAHGDQTSLLVERFEDVTVIEPATEFLEQTRARVGDRVVFENVLVEEFRTDRRFDTIIFSHVLEHVADPVATLARLGDLLTPAGLVYVVVPNADAVSRRIAVKMGLLDHREALSDDDLAAGHRRVYRLDTLGRDVRAAGLRTCHTGGIFFKPLANFQLNGLIGGPLLGDDFLEGCYLLGLEDAAACSSIYVIAGPGR